jgi:hypothetical protein
MHGGIVARKSVRDSLIEQAVKRQRDAGRKVNRQKSKSINFAGSEFDVRKDPLEIPSLSTSELRSYLKTLDNFIDRRTQFVPDAHRRPIPAQEFREYKNVEKQVKNAVENNISQLDNIIGPDGKPLGERFANMIDKHRKRMGDDAASSIYSIPDKKSTQIDSRDAIPKLIDAQLKKLDPGYYDQKVREGREQFALMNEINGDTEMAAEVAKLTDYQFGMMWNNTEFANTQSIRYQHMGNITVGIEWVDVLLNEKKSGNKIIEWAKTLRDPNDREN